MPQTGTAHAVTIFDAAASLNAVSAALANPHLIYGVAEFTVTAAAGLTMIIAMDGSFDDGATWGIMANFTAISANGVTFQTVCNQRAASGITAIAPLNRFRINALAGKCNLLIKWWDQKDTGTGN